MRSKICGTLFFIVTQTVSYTEHPQTNSLRYYAIKKAGMCVSTIPALMLKRVDLFATTSADAVNDKPSDTGDSSSDKDECAFG